MLETFRELANKKIVKLVFALFLVIPFGLFGIDFYFNTPVGGDTLATVGRTRLSSVEFEQALRQQADLYRQQLRGSFDPAIMDNPEIRRAVMDRLINQRLVDLGSRRAGLQMSDRELAERITTEPSFQVDGHFSKDRYEQAAKAVGLSPVGLDERLRQDMREQQYRSAVVDTAFVPRATLDSFINLSEQMREVSVVNLTPDAYVVQAKVTPEQVKAWYEAHPRDYTTPEQVRVAYVELSLDTLAAQAKVAPEELKATYDQELPNGKWGQPEERRASHILITVKPDAKPEERSAAEAKAREIAARVRKNPKSFADEAKRESQDPGSAPNGGDLGFFRRGAMVKPFEDAVYAAKKGDIVGPVKSDFGYHVIQVTEVKDSKVKTLAEATPEIEATLRKQAASRQMAQAAENFSNTVYEQPTALKPAAAAQGLAVRESGWIRKGASADPAFLGNPKVQAEIFSENSIKANRNTSAIEVAPNDLVAAHVIEHKAAELQPFESVRGDIERRLKREAATKLAAEDGAQTLKELQEGRDRGLKWPAPLAVNRQKPGGLPSQVIEAAFRLDPKKLPAYVGADTAIGYSLVRVGKVVDADKPDEAKRKALASRLRDAVAAEEFDAALGSLRERIGVTLRKGALDKPAATPAQ